MARGDKKARQQKTQMDAHERTVRRNQIIFAVLAAFLILSMVLSMLITM